MRLLGLSEDRANLVLTGPETGTVSLPVDERLKAAVLGDAARLEQLEIKVESALSPREIQARLRSGQTAEQVASAAGVPVDRVRRFEGPVRDERLHAVEAARKATTRRGGDGSLPMGEQADEHLAQIAVEQDSVVWDSWRREDGTWLVQLAFRSADRARTAHWLWDPAKRALSAADADAAAISDVEATDGLLEGIAAVVGDAHPSRIGLSLVREDEPPAGLMDDLVEMAQPDALPIDVVDDPEPEVPSPERTVPERPERRTGSTDRQAEADGVAPGRRATVPSWDEILFGTRPPEH
jgi:hypothetical protein